MNYRQLGNTETSVSEVCMGCWQISSERGDYWGRQEVRDSMEAVRASLEAGVTFFDTAEDYDDGGSEQVLGEALQGRRAEAVIATKLNPRHASEAELRKACEGSLRRLKTDYIDLYQVHFPNPDVPVAETLGALEELRESGKIRAFGVSNFGVSFMRDLPVGRAASNQLPYSLLWRGIEQAILPMCIDRGMVVLAYSPLAQGLLTGKYRRLDDLPRERRQTRLFEPALKQTAGPLVDKAIGDILDLADRAGVSPPDLALAWVLAQPGVCSVIAGARNAKQARQNAAASDVQLAPDVVEELTTITEALKAALGDNADMWNDQSRMERQSAKA
jgi:aryl-alcohol dehydrogenase-like predicted oxidoreductase